MNAAIRWVRRDLRLSDNPALSAAVAQGGAVIPCFILDLRLMDNPNTAPKRRAFLLAGLAQVPAKYIHESWKMTPEEQDRYGCRIGRDYPAPINDHRFARQRTLDAYAQARSQGDA